MLTFIWIDEAWVSLVNRAQSAVGAGRYPQGPNVSRPVHRLARLSGSVGSVSAGWRDELVTLLPPSAARCSPRLSVVLSFTGHVRTRWVCAASRALAVADAFPRSRRLFVRTARPRLAAWKARCHPDVSGWITRVRVRLRNGDVRGPGRRARGYLDPPSVSVGDTVTMGAQIGAVEEGSQTLHWGAKTGRRTYIDPIRMTMGRPRLLPWDDVP